MGRGLNLNLTGLREVKGPDEEGMQLVADALGIPRAALQHPRFFESSLLRDGGNAPVALMLCEIAVEGKDSNAVLAVDARGSIAAAAVLDAAGNADPAWAGLVSQLTAQSALALDGIGSPLEIERAKEKNGSPAEREVAAVLRERELMAHCASLVNSVTLAVRTDPSSVNPAQLEELVAVMDEMGKLSEPLEKLLDAGQVSYQQAAATVRTSVAQALDEARASNWSGMQSRLQGVMNGCTSCHGIRNHKLSGPLALPLQDAMKMKRARLGFGTHYYHVGFDLIPPPNDDGSAQRVADAMKTAAALLGTMCTG